MTQTEVSTLCVPPGHLGLPVLGETLSFLLNPDFAKKRHQKYGHIFKTSIFGVPTIFVRGGEGLRFVVNNENKFFINNLPPSTKALLVPLSLPLQTGMVHASRRRLLYQAFAPRTLAAYVDTINQISQRYLESWVKQGTLTWYPELRK